MILVEKAILGAKLLIERGLKRNNGRNTENSFDGYQRFYYSTNENISAYIDLVSYEGKDCALTVTSSGDHAFNLVTKGITNIDTFDINRLTEYYALGLKRAMILKYNYQDFIYVFGWLTSPLLSLDNLTEIISGLLPYMDKKYRIFWQTISDYNYQMQTLRGTNINLLSILSLESRLVMEYNGYLKDEESYNALRNNLASANITFTYANAISLTENFSKKYDLILLSNIMDYFYLSWGRGWNYAKLQQYEKELEKLLTPDGVVFLKYIMTYQENGNLGSQVFGNSPISTLELTSEELHVLPETSFSSKSAVVLKRTK